MSKVNIAGKKKKIVSATYTDKSSAKVSLASSVQVGNGSSRTKAIQITGNKLGNTIQGGKGDDSIFGGAGNDKLYGGKGDDTLIGGNGNDTLTGGDGEDVFVGGTGNDFIADYAWDDKILIGASITSSTFKDSDAVFTIGKSTLTVKNGRSMNIVFIDADDTEQTIIGGAQLIDDSSSSKVKLAADVEVADASARTKKIQINGNKLDNMITGGAGNDSLSGGKGNDWLWGNAGTDTFIYGSGDGHDVICDFGNDDLLKITGKFSASYSKSKGEVYFKVGNTSKAITLQDFTASTFHVNDSTYKISGTKLKKF